MNSNRGSSAKLFEVEYGVCFQVNRLSLFDLLRKSDEYLWSQFVKEEEYNTQALDRLGRFPHTASKFRNVLQPAVSDFLLANGLEVTYPNGSHFAVCLTHDVDYLYFPRGDSFRSSVRSLKDLELRKAIKWLRAGIKRKSTIIQNIPRIIDVETEYNAKSSFFFLAQDESAVDFIYPIKEFEESLGLITDRGFEVGLHGSLLAYGNQNLLQTEKRRLEKHLGKKVIGYRNHFLRFELPTTWELLEKAGFKYDTTFGYHDALGFRNGMCHIFQPFNITTNAFVNIWEIPLVIMDRTLLETLSIDPATAWEMIRQIIDVTEARQGIIAILWHNSRMFDDLLTLYRKMLRYCSEKGAWLCSGEEIVSWWSKNKFFVP